MHYGRCACLNTGANDLRGSTGAFGSMQHPTQGPSADSWQVLTGPVPAHRALSPALPVLAGASEPPAADRANELQQPWRPSPEEAEILTLQCAPVWGAPPDGTFFLEDAFARYSVSKTKVSGLCTELLGLCVLQFSAPFVCCAVGRLADPPSARWRRCMRPVTYLCDRAASPPLYLHLRR